MNRLIARSYCKLNNLLHQQQAAGVVPLKDGPEKTVDKSIIHNKEFNIKFKKLQINDKQLSTLMLTLKSKKKLNKENQIIVEGNQLIKEAVMSHIQLNYLLFSHIDKTADVAAIMGSSAGSVQFMKVPQQDLSFYSTLTTCPGLIGIFTKPRSAKPRPDALPITVIGDNIREPNNVGAVIRLSNALPAAKVLLPKGCADPWDVKAIRGSSGAIFQMATDYSLSWEEIGKMSDVAGSTVLIADNNVSKYPISRVIDYDKIPESLIKDKQIYLVLGGETHGISEDALSFSKQSPSWRVVHIPLVSSMDSLNTSNALAIILFELRRRMSDFQ